MCKELGLIVKNVAKVKSKIMLNNKYQINMIVVIKFMFKQSNNVLVIKTMINLLINKFTCQR